MVAGGFIPGTRDHISPRHVRDVIIFYDNDRGKNSPTTIFQSLRDVNKNQTDKADKKRMIMKIVRGGIQFKLDIYSRIFKFI